MRPLFASTATINVSVVRHVTRTLVYLASLASPGAQNPPVSTVAAKELPIEIVVSVGETRSGTPIPAQTVDSLHAVTNTVDAAKTHNTFMIDLSWMLPNA